MIEYPSIINSKKAPRKQCIAFDKLDGSNLRFKHTKSKGFHVFGTRTQLVDESTPMWGNAVKIFRNTLEEPLTKLFETKTFSDHREIIVFGEFLGANSFAGRHEDEDHKIVVFDIMVGHKQRKFLNPKDFVKLLSDKIEIPRVVYEGNLNEEFVQRVRVNEFNLKEGVICKGTESSGAFVGGIWQCKIKTQEYLDKLKGKFGDDWIKYAE